MWLLKDAASSRLPSPAEGREIAIRGLGKMTGRKMSSSWRILSSNHGPRGPSCRSFPESSHIMTE